MKTLRYFISFYKPYKKIFFLDLLCAILISMIDLSFPLILNYSAEYTFTQSASFILTHIIGLGIFLLAIYTLRAYCKYYVSCQGHVMGALMEKDMRKDLFEQFQNLSFSYYDKHNTGIMMSKMVSDLFDISEFAHHGPENLFISIIKIVGSFIILSTIYWPLAFVLSLVTICMAIFSYTQNKYMRKTFAENRRKIGDINATLQDSLGGIRVVQSFTNEEKEMEKFENSNMAFLVSKKDNYRAMGTFQGGNNFFQGLLYVTVIVAGGYFIAQGSLSPVTLATFALYINVFVSPIEVLVEFTEMFQKGLSGFRRFEEVIREIPEIQDKENAKEFELKEGRIVFEDVSFQYDNESVLDHIDLDIQPGKKLALVGPSGSGKTTLCSLISRFYDVNSGSIRIDDQDIRDVKLKSLRQNIGLVQQDVYLFNGTIEENIAYGRLEASHEEIIEAAKRANIHEFILSLENGYQTYVGERGARLSGGQKQRISIARLFLKNPKILILDEATSALDNESERIIQKSLEELSVGRTCITIAHRLSTIRNADEIVVLDAEGIHERGNHQELMEKNGIYYKYYNLQFEGL